MKTLKALSALLSYPTEDFIEALPEIMGVIRRENLLNGSICSQIEALANELSSGELYDKQEAYGLLFDRTRSLSLHLFEHVHGESRDRGQAMVDLIKLYEDGGWTPTTEELPDYLPLFLEYAATQEPKEAIELIGQPAHVFEALRERLAKRRSPYESIFAALLAIARAKPDLAALEKLRAEPDPEPDDLAALDAAWEEEEVTFGPGAAAQCGADTLAVKLRAARRPAEGMTTPPPRRPDITHSTNTRA